MFCRHDLDSVVEVLLFAVARQVIIEHTSMVDNLLCMLSVAILFCIRKFLFVSALDKKEPALKAINPVFKGAVSQQTPSQKQNEKKGNGSRGGIPRTDSQSVQQKFSV